MMRRPPMSAHAIALQNRFLGRGTTIYDRIAALRREAGFVRPEALRELAAETGLPPAQVFAVASFYDELAPRRSAPPWLRLCNGEACFQAGGERLRRELAADGAADERGLGEVTCLGLCFAGPAALAGGQPVSLAGPREREEVLAAWRAGREVALDEPELPVHDGPGPKVLLPGLLAARRSLAEARAAGAFGALERALDLGPEAVRREVERSGLRGRGGAGFPTGRKLEAVAAAACPGGVRYAVLNADEGDPGAFIDKALLERDPFAVLEGLAIAAFACGAREAIVYLRAEYPRARAIFGRALAEAEAAGFVGETACGGRLSLSVRLVDGHGAYVCGEETSLLRSLEGVPAQVSPKPPYPAECGYRGAPTLVLNVETAANLPWIVREGGAAYAAFGRGSSRGTKLVSLSGAVARPGLYEIELGTSLRSLLADLAGGPAPHRRIQAVQIGGPLGGILPPAELDTPLTFEDLAAKGALLGHGGVVVHDEGVDLVALGRLLLRFCAVESCGKCFPCRIGSVRGVELFDRLLAGRAAPAELALLEDLLETMRLTSLCQLGGGVPTPLQNLLRWFRPLFEARLAGEGRREET